MLYSFKQSVVCVGPKSRIRLDIRRALCMINTMGFRFFSKSFFVFVLMLCALSLQAQNSQTAMDVFDRIAAKYNGMTDYEVDIRYEVGNSSMSGILYYKKPDKVRINFSRPANQVIVSNGKELTCYLPQTGVTFVQKLERNGNPIGVVAGEEGLSFMKKNYKISYNETPEFVQVEGLDVPVLGLRLVWRFTKAGFREIVLYVDQNFNILRFEGIDAAQNSIICTFSDYQYNTGIPDTRFDYTSPPTSYKQNNFLFDPTGE